MRLEYRNAIREALDEALAADDRVMFFGEDVAAAGGVFRVTPELTGHGEQRVFDTPISELALASAAFGAAITGLRPVIEIMFGDFLMLAMDSIVNQAAKYWYVSGGQHPVPLVVRSAVGGGVRFGAIHSQDPSNWFLSVPGLKVLCPSTPTDAKALLRAAIEDDNPVLFFEHKRLYSMKEEADDAPAPLAIGRARVVREGGDVTIVSAMKGVHDALAAADALQGDGIQAEVVDLRSLRPLDLDTVLASVAKTNRLVAVEEGPAIGGWGHGIAGAVTAAALEDLDDVVVLGTPSLAVPFSPPLEDAFFPDAERIAGTIRQRLGAGAAS